MEIEEYLITCIYCGEEFTAFAKNAKYCCELCRNEYYKTQEKNKIKKPNRRDELVIYKVTQIIERGIEGMENWKDQINLNYSDRGFTNKIKEEVLTRDGYECFICGKGTGLEVHHIVKRIYGGGNDLDNLVCLCTSCHRTIDTLDINRAIKKCTTNASKYFGKEKKIKDIYYQELLEDVEYNLNRIYRALTNIDNEDIPEILIELDELITSIE